HTRLSRDWSSDVCSSDLSADMAELTSHFGTWTFDGQTLRITPGTHRRVHKVRKVLGELAIPLTAIAGMSYEPGRKTGRVRVRLRSEARRVGRGGGPRRAP